MSNPRAGSATISPQGVTRFWSGVTRFLVMSIHGLVASLEMDWAIAVGRPYDDAGRAARNEMTVLRLVKGDGCVCLLRSDEERGALLLERLGRSLHELTRPLRPGGPPTTPAREGRGPPSVLTTDSWAHSGTTRPGSELPRSCLASFEGGTRRAHAEVAELGGARVWVDNQRPGVDRDADGRGRFARPSAQRRPATSVAGVLGRQ